MRDNERESGHAVHGAHYSGSVVGGGDIGFDVSAAGDEVQNLGVTQIPCNSGVHDEFPWPLSIAVADGQFHGTLDPLAIKVSGQFLPEGKAVGTFMLDFGDCRSPELSWTATAATPTSTSTPGP